MEQKQDKEDEVSLITSQLSHCPVWIVVPRMEQAEKCKVALLLQTGLKSEPGIKQSRYDKFFHFEGARDNSYLGGFFNVFHTTLILKQEDISKFLFTIVERYPENVLRDFPSLIKLVPEGQEHAFWNEEKMMKFMIVRWGNVYFRGKFHLFKDQKVVRRHKVMVTWDLIKAGEYGRTHKDRVYAEEDEAVEKEKVMEALGPRYTSFRDAVFKLRKWCESDEIHLVCGCWFFSKDYVEVSTFKAFVSESDLTVAYHLRVWESDQTFKAESLAYRGLDLSPIRKYTTSKISFTKALEDVRGQFVRLLPVKLPHIEHEYQELKRRFDRNFLLMPTGGLECIELYIMYDERREKLYLVCLKVFDCSDFDLLCSQHYPSASTMDVHWAVRRNWIKYQCLHGQDDEFNIFRSLCFAPQSSVLERYQIGFVALTLQILLSIGIAVDTVQMWSNKYTSFEDFAEKIKSFEYQFEETLIVIISIFTFAFILQRLRKTIESFKRFYSNMKEVCIIPNEIIAFDFTSNIVVGTLMAIVTPFFLLQSENIQTVVLNSFALTFFIELDDLANVYESDEPFLLQEDKNGWQRLYNQWYNERVKILHEPLLLKRQITGLGSIYKSIKMTGLFLFSPFIETFHIIMSLVGMCCCKKQQDQDQVFQSLTNN